MKYHCKIIIIVSFIVLISYVCIGLYSGLQVTYYTYESPLIPDDFHDYRIVHLSDLHCKNFGKNNTKLIREVLALNPDIVVITGDTVDEDHQDISSVTELLEGICPYVHVFAVSGNHEFIHGSPYNELLALYQATGVCNLDNLTVELTRGDSSIVLTGLSGEKLLQHNPKILNKANPKKFNILLYHYTDMFDYVIPYNYSLILSGHAHGGIIRLPFVGGILGNEGNLFPGYTSGMKQEGVSTMISSRGLGDAKLPRFYNRPEIVCITLNSTSCD